MEAYWSRGVQALLDADEINVACLEYGAEQGAGVLTANGWEIEVRQHDGFVTLDIPGI